MARRRAIIMASACGPLGRPPAGRVVGSTPTPSRVRVTPWAESSRSSSARARCAPVTAGSAGVGIRRGVVQRLEDGAADQLLEEGGGDAVGALDGGRDVVAGQLERHAPAVEREQPFPGGPVGQGDLDRDVDPARAGRQRELEQVGPVGGEQEEQVGVAGRAVHRVQQVEQDRVGPRPHPALLGHQVHVLEDHDGGREGARHLGDRADGDKRAAGQHQPRVGGHLAEQVAGGVRLAGAGRPVQQQAALEVLARRRAAPRGDRPRRARAARSGRARRPAAPRRRG